MPAPPLLPIWISRTQSTANDTARCWTAWNAEGGRPFKLEPEAVARKLVHAVESPRPKVRYRVTVPTYAASVLKRILPTRLLDRVAARA